MIRPVSCEARLTLADAVYRVAGCSVMTEALVETARTKPTRGTRLRAVRARPPPRAPAGAGHVVTLPAIETGAPAHAPPAVGAGGAGLATEGAREARRALTAACPVVTGPVT